MRISDWSSDVCSSDLINLSALVGSGDFSQKTDRTTDVLQHMAQHNGVSRQAQIPIEGSLDHIRVVTFIGRIDPGDGVAQASQHLQEVAFATDRKSVV